MAAIVLAILGCTGVEPTGEAVEKVSRRAREVPFWRTLRLTVRNPQARLFFFFVGAVLLATLLVHALPAAAGSPEPMGTTADDALWEMRLAGFTRYGAAYPAAGESQLNVVPLPFPIYRGRILRVGDNTEKPIRTRIFRLYRLRYMQARRCTD